HAAGRLTTEDHELYARFTSIPRHDAIYPPRAIASLYPLDRIAFQLGEYRALIDAQSDLLLNTDKRPRALTFALLFMAQRAAPFEVSSTLMTVLLRHGMWIALCGVMLYALLRAIYIHRTAQPHDEGCNVWRTYDTCFLVASAGWVGLSLSIMLIYMLQSTLGDIFLFAGLMTSLYMLGLVAGGSLTHAFIGHHPVHARKLLVAAIAAQALLMGILVMTPLPPSHAIFALLFFVAGASGGIYVPLASAELYKVGLTGLATGSAIEWSDHLGGAAGAALTGLFLLPVLGTGATAVIMVLLLLVNLFVLSINTPATPAPHRAFRILHPLGYALFGIAVLLMVTQLTYRASCPASGEIDSSTELSAVAREMTGQQVLQKREIALTGRKTGVYFTAPASGQMPEQHVFLSQDFAPSVVAYGGPIHLAVMTDNDGTLMDFRVLHHRETPDYFKLLKGWLVSLSRQPLVGEDAFAGTDTVSGATVSSRAIINQLRGSGQGFAQAVLGHDSAAGAGERCDRLPVSALVLLAFCIAAPLIRGRLSRKARPLYLIGVVLVFGVWLNIQYASCHVASLLWLSVPAPSLSTSFLIIALVPLVTVLFGNVYCGYLCPFGALQELMGKLHHAKPYATLHPTACRVARFAKYAALFGMVLFAVIHGPRLAAQRDPLTRAFLPGSAFREWLIFPAAILFISLFFNRFWCRTLCPTGAFLALLNGVRILKRLVPSVPWQHCDYGVSSAGELDCICCDRCRRGAAQPVAKRSDNTAWRVRDYVFLALVVATLVWMVVPREAPPSRTDAVQHSVQQSTGQPRDVDMIQLQNMIQRGQLSNHEALYYEQLHGDEH
ncbi:MAG: 4Fe-4S binding protein, partial [Verrucomicrobia bacterium]|nr:4Fe-4S binding protein [Verrucomicrobiota bacterium]